MPAVRLEHFSPRPARVEIVPWAPTAAVLQWRNLGNDWRHPGDALVFVELPSCLDEKVALRYGDCLDIGEMPCVEKFILSPRRMAGGWRRGHDDVIAFTSGLNESLEFR